MKRYLHLGLSGANYLTFSLGTEKDDNSCLDEYLSAISSLGIASSCYRRIEQLANGTLSKRWEYYHPYTDWGEPLIYVVKYPKHRFFLVYDTQPKFEKMMIIYIYCSKKDSQKTRKQVINKCISMRDFYFGHLSQMEDIIL